MDQPTDSFYGRDLSTVADFLRWKPAMSPLKAFVVSRLRPEDFFSLARSAWLDECGQFLDGEPTDASVLAAAEACIEDRRRRGIKFDFDPYDLLMYAGLWQPDPTLADSELQLPGVSN